MSPPRAPTAELTSTIRALAEDARIECPAEAEPYVYPLAGALDHIANLLDEHDGFLVDLRNWKADAQ